jgi:hypothetical protein
MKRYYEGAKEILSVQDTLIMRVQYTLIMRVQYTLIMRVQDTIIVSFVYETLYLWI